MEIGFVLQAWPKFSCWRLDASETSCDTHRRDEAIFSARDIMARIARSRREMALASYRSSFASSGRIRLIASAVRSGCCAGIVTEGSINFGIAGLGFSSSGQKPTPA
jgi:hypothetical protein